MSTRVLLIVFTLALTACEASPMAQRRTAARQQTAALAGMVCPLDSGTCVPVSPPTTMADACFDDRWVAVLASHGDCPEPVLEVGGQWRTSPVFTNDASWVVPPSLRLFCLYRWEPTVVGNAPDLVSLSRLDARFARRDRDCAAVKGEAESRAVETTWRSLRAQFLAQAGWAPLPVVNQNVRVALIDAAPTRLAPGPVGPDRTGHGETVGQVIHELACPADGGTCPTKVVTHLALPLVAVGREDELHGGRFGYQSQIAQAVFEAVASWRRFNALGGEQHRRLVLNLSVGWEPVFGGDAASLADLPAPVRAVHSALLHARCQGALPIAAAGNDPGGSPAPAGPLYPAAWEEQSAPDAAQCAALEGAGYTPAGLLAPPTPGDYQPLVFSVSGVRGDGAVLTSARPGGRARLVAPAAHVSMKSVNGGPTAGLTGSSIAAAVVSASAAAAWTYRPELPASSLMEQVWTGATVAGVRADYCLGGHPCPIPVTAPRAGVRRVSLCGAVAAACSAGACTVSCSPVSTTATTVSTAELAVIARNAEWRSTDGGVVVEAPAVCGAGATFESAKPTLPTTVCAERQYPNLGSRPVLGNPQPGSNPCPAACVLVPQDQLLYLSLDPKFLSLGLREATLKVGDDYLALDIGILAETPEVVIEGVKVDTSVEKATLLFTVEGVSEEFSTQSELVIKR